MVLLVSRWGRAITRLFAPLASLSAIAVAGAGTASGDVIANPGTFSAPGGPSCMIDPTANSPACAGFLDFESGPLFFGYAGGGLQGASVDATGKVTIPAGAATFGSATLVAHGSNVGATTDANAQLLTIQVLAAGAGTGSFTVPAGSSPTSATGLQLSYTIPVYVQVTGGGVGTSCTIGSASSPVSATFGGGTSMIIGSKPSYDQSTGQIAVFAPVTLPAATNCQGEEPQVDQTLGLPGAAEIQQTASASPVIQTPQYAHPASSGHHHRHHHHRRR